MVTPLRFTSSAAGSKGWVMIGLLKMGFEGATNEVRKNRQALGVPSYLLFCRHSRESEQDSSTSRLG
jgi:F0F1-type ATP synthase assembly protein I